MATYKVYRKGNFLEVVDLDNGQVWNAPVYDAFIEKLHDPLQYRYRFHFSDGKFLDRILLEEIVDENSAPYTAQSFDTFRTCKLGYVPIGFGCGESINIPQDFLDLADTPDSYSGAANQYVRVNSTATGLEFFSLDLSIYAEIANLGATAFSNDYNDLDNLPVVSSTNLYNTDGTFTGNRTVTGATYNLTFNTLGDLKFNSKTTGYLMGYYDVGNGRPEFVLDGANGNQTWARFRNNGTDIRNTFSVGTSIWEQYREWQVRSIVTNNIHMIRDIEGRWMFANDASGLDTPDTDTRMKIASDGLAFALKTDAKVRMTNLPTSSAGLSTGDLWNDGGTLKIV